MKNALSMLLIGALLLGGLVVDLRQAPPRPPLRELAAEDGLLIGAASHSSYLDSPRYASQLAREFNSVTSEVSFKFANIHPEPERYDFAPADTLVSFAGRHEMKVRAHTLVWQLAVPSWLIHRTWEPNELNAVLRDHIHTVVGRYRGRIYAYDVVNEVMADEGVLAQDFWMQNLGPEYIENAFRWAHEADPEALLFYNESRAEDLGPKSDAVYALVKDLLARGVPIDGVGMQMHIGPEWDAAGELRANIERLAALGLRVHITELDVRLPDPPSAAGLAVQAEVYRQVVAACLETPGCEAVTTWGVDDGTSWIPYYYPGYGSALLLDARLNPKPAYHAVFETLRSHDPQP